MNKPTSVLFITLTNIGDVVLSTTLLNAILKDYPNAEVDVVCGAKSAVLFKDFPNLRSLHAVKKLKHHMHHLKILRTFWREKYDIVVDLRTPLTGHIMRGKYTIMFKKDNDLHRAEQFAQHWNSKHEVKQLVWLNPALQEKAHKEISQHTGPVIAMAPTANWIKKQWPEEKFIELVDKMNADPAYKDAMFMLLGAPHERELVENLLNHIPEDRMINLYDNASGLDEVQAYLAEADVFIGNDSGLAHIAAALDVPTLTLFGPTQDCLYRPYGNMSHIIAAPESPREVTGFTVPTPSRLIKDIDVNDVYTETLNMLKQYSKKNKAVS